MSSDHDLDNHNNNNDDDKISDHDLDNHNKTEDHDDDDDGHDEGHGHGHDDGDDDDDDDGDDYEMVRDVIMWRRRKISGGVLMVTTGVWVMLQVYGFKFVPLVSWTLMAFIALLFSHGLFLRLLSKDRASMRKLEWEMTEERGKEIGESTKKMIEKGIRWLFYVSCEKEWYIFLGVISSLLLLAYVGHYLDFITLLFIGTMLGMTVPVIYMRKEDVIKSYVKRVNEQCIRMYHKFSDKAFAKFHTKKKEKKVE